jgi:hypothetical protein
VANQKALFCQLLVVLMAPLRDDDGAAQKPVRDC